LTISLLSASGVLLEPTGAACNSSGSKKWKWVDIVKPPQIRPIPDVLTVGENQQVTCITLGRSSGSKVLYNKLLAFALILLYETAEMETICLYSDKMLRSCLIIDYTTTIQET
jgi:hypothetical protein